MSCIFFTRGTTVKYKIQCLFLTISIILLAFLGTPAKVFAATPTNITLGEPVKSGSNFQFPSLVVEGTSNISLATVSTTNGTVAITTNAAYTVSYDLPHTTATLIFQPALSPNQVQTLLRSNVRFTPTNAVSSCIATISIDGNKTLLPASGIVSAGNGALGKAGHYYMYVSDSLTWNDAYDAAKTYYCKGLQGYLTTMTEPSENAIFASLSTQDKVWSGGTRLIQDAYDTDTWTGTETDHNFRWVCGPEAGEIFYYGWTHANNTLIQPDTFTNWAGSSTNSQYEPNNISEYSMMLNYYGDLSWNDLYPTWACCYYVEFGGYESDPGAFDVTKTATASASLNRPTIKDTSVYANGYALLITQGTSGEGYTTIYWDSDNDGSLDDTLGTETTNKNLSSWNIYGGSENIDMQADTPLPTRR